jgi:hypothetical protein
MELNRTIATPAQNDWPRLQTAAETKLMDAVPALSKKRRSRRMRVKAAAPRRAWHGRIRVARYCSEKSQGVL